MTGQGRFIVREGPEVAGKTTQAARLAARLPGAVVTREPGGTRGGEVVREALLSTEARWSPLAEALLMYAARDAHLHEVILPALEAGRHVLCDRFADSTEAYQGGGGGLDDGVIAALRKAVVRREPDLVLLFDLPAEEGLARAAARGRADRFEAKGLDYHRRVRARFLDIARNRGAAVIDAAGDPDAVEARVRLAVSTALPGLLTDGA
jgi:dTMP kinase